MPSVSARQAKLMSAIKHGWQPPASMKYTPSLKVATEFHEADKRVGKFMHAEGGKISGLRALMDELNRLWHTTEFREMTPSDISRAHYISRTLPEYNPGGVPMDPNVVTRTATPPPQQLHAEGGKVEEAVKALGILFNRPSRTQGPVADALNRVHKELFTGEEPNFQAAYHNLQHVPQSGVAQQRLRDYLALGVFDPSNFHRDEFLKELNALGSSHGLDVSAGPGQYKVPLGPTSLSTAQQAGPVALSAAPGMAAGGKIDKLARKFLVKSGQTTTGPVTVPIHALTQNRVLNEDNVGKIQKAMAGGADMDPIVIDTGGNILDGNHRVEAARRLGMTHTRAHVIHNKPRTYADGGHVGATGSWEPETSTEHYLDLISHAADRATTALGVDDPHQALARVAAGLGSQVLGLDDQGKVKLGARPGIINETLALPAGLSDLATGAARKFGPLMDRYMGTDVMNSSGAAGSAFGALGAPMMGVQGVRGALGLINALADKYEPATWSREAEKTTDRAHEAVRRAMGLAPPRGWVENLSEAGGTMLGQLPVGAARAGEGMLVKLAKSPVEWLGPTIRPSAKNYLAGTVAGGTLGKLTEDPQHGASGSW